MAKTDHPKMLWPVLDLIERQQAIINVLVNRVNELSEAVLTDVEPISIDGIGIESVDLSVLKSKNAPSEKTVSVSTDPATEVDIPKFENTGEPEVAEEQLAPEFYQNSKNNYYFDPDSLNIYDGKYTLKIGASKGTFSFSDSSDSQFSFIYDTMSTVDPIADYEEDASVFAGKDEYVLKTIIPGEIDLIGGQWVVTKKAKVRFEKQND